MDCNQVEEEDIAEQRKDVTRAFERLERFMVWTVGFGSNQDEGIGVLEMVSWVDPLVYHLKGGWQQAYMHQGVNGVSTIMNKRTLLLRCSLPPEVPTVIYVWQQFFLRSLVIGPTNPTKVVHYSGIMSDYTMGEGANF